MSLTLSDGRLLTLSDALRGERDLLARLRRSTRTKDLWDFLWSRRSVIEAICAQHLGVESRQCAVQEQNTWKKGQFNICVLISVTGIDGTIQRKVLRCPIAHKVAEPYRPGAMDEKVRVEVANYAFLRRNCPELPIPHLAGFGLSDDQRFTHEQHLFWLSRWCCKIRRMFLSALRSSTQSPYTRSPVQLPFGIPYILIDFIESSTGNMLSDTWAEHRDDPRKRENLLHGLSRLMLSLARCPQSRIGCLRFNDDSSISLSNAPLLCANMLLESEGATRTLNCTSTSPRQLLFGLLRFREAVFRRQGNAARNDSDCRLQMSHFVMLELLIRRYIEGGEDYDYQYVLQYTDLHASNIFVDDDWNITGVIDLEFVCSLPLDMLSVPSWLTVDYIDDIADHLEEHQKHREEFLKILDMEEQQQKHKGSPNLSLTSAMRQAWSSGGTWIYRCFTSVDALSSIVEDHLWPRFGFRPSLDDEELFTKCLSHFWSENSADQFVQQKMRDKFKYDDDVKAHFQAAFDI